MDQAQTLPFCEQAFPFGKNVRLQALLQYLHFATVGKDEGGRDVSSVGHFQNGAGELAIVGYVVQAPSEHHGYLHSLVFLYEELFLFGFFWIEFILPPGLELKTELKWHKCTEEKEGTRFN